MMFEDMATPDQRPPVDTPLIRECLRGAVGTVSVVVTQEQLNGPGTDCG